MICSKCGHQNSEGAKFCGNCGSPLVPAEKRKKNKYVWAIVPILLAVALISQFLLNSPETKVIRAIDSIGEVAMDSEPEIVRVEELYNALDESQKAKVTNSDVLEKARAEYDRQKRLIEKAVSTVDVIGTVSLESSAEISSAREAYNAAQAYDVSGTLSESQAILEQAETEYEILLEKERKFQVETEAAVSKAEELLAYGQNAEAEEICISYITQLSDGDRKNQFGNILVQAQCAQAQELFDQGDSLAAMEILRQSIDYESCCDTAVFDKVETLAASFTKELSQNAPQNGAILERTYGAGRNTFTVTAGSYDSCVKLELVEDPQKYVVFYVKANETVTIGILNGEYRIKFTNGPIWYGSENMFGPDATYVQFDDTMTVAGYTSSDAIHWHVVTCTLTTGYGDDWGYQNMAPSDF